jgi:hypothetical protein
MVGPANESLLGGFMRRPSRTEAVCAGFLGVGVLLSPVPVCAVPSGVPSAANSVVQSDLVTCPAGHLTFTVVVKDAAGLPVSNSTVVVDFCSAPTVDICSTPGCTFTGTSDASGYVVLNIPSGGVVGTALANVKADGVLLAQRAVASTDQTGDLMVTMADVNAINALVGTSDKRGDLDGDGFVTAADVAIVQAHMGHVCAGPVRSHDDTWGILKIRYR